MAADLKKACHSCSADGRAWKDYAPVTHHCTACGSYLCTEHAVKHDPSRQVSSECSYGRCVEVPRG